MENDKLLTMADLIAEGYGKEFLYRVAHMRNTPFFRTTPRRGKFYVIKSKFIDFISSEKVK